MRVTQKDIAKRVNLSQSTVAQVLSNKPGVWVSEENRQRIHALAKEMNYRPNAAARSLRNGRYNTVTFTYLRLEDQFSRIQISLAVETLAHRLGELGYELKVKVFISQEDLLQSLNDLTLTRDSDAVVLWGDETMVEDQAKLLEDRAMPFVLKGRFEKDHPSWLQADFDHETMMANAVKRLVGLGHERIAYRGNSRMFRYSRLLFGGYREAMKSFGLTIEDAWVSEGESSVVQAEAAMTDWLALPVETAPTAVVIGTGNNAWIGFEAALAKHGRRIGEGHSEFSVVGTSLGSLILSFGHGMAYQNIAFHDLADQMYHCLLAPLLCQGAVESSTVRITPDLTPVYSLEQLRYVVFQS